MGPALGSCSTAGGANIQDTDWALVCGAIRMEVPTDPETRAINFGRTRCLARFVRRLLLNRQYHVHKTYLHVKPEERRTVDVTEVIRAVRLA